MASASPSLSLWQEGRSVTTPRERKVCKGFLAVVVGVSSFLPLPLASPTGGVGGGLLGHTRNDVVLNGP